MKAEKYLIVTEGQMANDGATANSATTTGATADGVTAVGLARPTTRVRFGFGAAGEEVQKLLSNGADVIRVRIDGTSSEAIFPKGKIYRLLDIKQRIKGLSAEYD